MMFRLSKSALLLKKSCTPSLALISARFSTGNFIKNEEVLISYLHDRLTKINMKPLASFPESIDDKILAGSNAREAITALQHSATHTIKGVPVDFRMECEDAVRCHVDEHRDGSRVSLLCNTGYQGSGKSVLQSFNMFNFVKMMDGNAIAVETTFNDDQSGIPTSKSGLAHSILRDVAVRVLHRLVVYFYLRSADPIDANEEALNAILDDRFLSLIGGICSPLSFAMRTVRYFLHAPENTPILIGVDELTKGCNDFSPKEGLRALMTTMDANPSLYLSVSVYTAIDLGRFISESARAVLWQSLPPLFHEGFSAEKINLLPRMLQPFCMESMRRNLPFDRDVNLPLYQQVTNLFALAGGHPRRIEHVFKSMRGFDGLCPESMLLSLQGSGVSAKESGREFADALKQWLSSSENADLPRLESLVPTASWNDVIYYAEDMIIDLYAFFEAIAIDCACPFTLRLHRYDDGVVSNHEVLAGSALGLCSVLSVRFGGVHSDPYTSLAFAFVPMIVLNKIDEPPASFGPCGQALLMLRDAVNEYMDVSTPAGKGLVKIVAASLLLKARSWERLRPFDICSIKYCGQRLKDLRVSAGPSVHYMTVDAFPEMSALAEGEASAMEADVEVQRLYEQMLKEAPDASGAIIVSSKEEEEDGDGGGILGLFKVSCGEWVLLVFERVEVYRETSSAKNECKTRLWYEEWRQNRGLYPVQPLCLKVSEKQVSVSVMHIAIVDRMPAESFGFVCLDNEGVCCIDDMQDWLPTAAYAYKTGKMIRRMLSPPQSSDCDHDGE